MFTFLISSRATTRTLLLFFLGHDLISRSAQSWSQLAGVCCSHLAAITGNYKQNVAAAIDSSRTPQLLWTCYIYIFSLTLAVEISCRPNCGRFRLHVNLILGLAVDIEVGLPLKLTINAPVFLLKYWLQAHGVYCMLRCRVSSVCIGYVNFTIHFRLQGRPYFSECLCRLGILVVKEKRLSVSAELYQFSNSGVDLLLATDV